MTTTVCIADLHEHLVDVPACDAVRIADDVSLPSRAIRVKHAFLVGPFRDWLERVPADEVVLVAGNRDPSLEAWGPAGRPTLPQCARRRRRAVRPPILGDAVAAMVSRLALPPRNGEACLASKFDLIPEDTDVVVGHGAPRGYGDAGDPSRRPASAWS